MSSLAPLVAPAVAKGEVRRSRPVTGGSSPVDVVEHILVALPHGTVEPSQPRTNTQ